MPKPSFSAAVRDKSSEFFSCAVILRKRGFIFVLVFDEGEGGGWISPNKVGEVDEATTVNVEGCWGSKVGGALKGLWTDDAEPPRLWSLP